MSAGEETWYCPFCDQKTVKVWVVASHLEFKKSRGSGESGMVAKRTKQKAEVLSGCSACGKSVEEVKKKMF